MAWGKSEVSGIAEGAALKSSRGGLSPASRNEAKVTSIRSSLFKKAANSVVSQVQTSNTQQGLVFKDEGEAKVIDRTLIHLTNASMEMCPYGRVNKKAWTKDIFALVHNGLRREMSDLSTILQAFKVIRENLSLTEYQELRGWWTVFSSIIADYLLLEQKVLFPWVLAATKQAKTPDARADAFLAGASARSKTLRGATMAIAKMFNTLIDPLPDALKALAPPRSKLASDIVLQIDRIISLMADYLWEEEMQLAGVTSAVYSESSERNRLFTQIVQFMTSDSVSRSAEWLVLQTRWMADPKLAKAHARALMSMATDCPYSKLQTQFEMKHAAVVSVFKVKGDM